MYFVSDSAILFVYICQIILNYCIFIQHCMSVEFLRFIYVFIRLCRPTFTILNYYKRDMLRVISQHNTFVWYTEHILPITNQILKKELSNISLEQVLEEQFLFFFRFYIVYKNYSYYLFDLETRGGGLK